MCHTWVSAGFGGSVLWGNTEAGGEINNLHTSEFKALALLISLNNMT